MLHRCYVVLLSLVACSPTAWARPQDPSPIVALEVLLTVAPTLPDRARASFIDEVTTIWRSQGVAIQWLSGAAIRPVSDNRLRVLVISRGQAVRDEGPLGVGELLRPGNGHAVAMASIENAERVVEHVRPAGSVGLLALDHRRLGLVLGRAVAHEIGHYLLDTHTHARSGLMRARFDAREFTDLRPGTFVLDRDAAAWLTMRLHRTTPAARAEDFAAFAYAR